jgi:predicted nucleic acid-binding protein
MKALDTPVLLRLLRGDGGARQLVRKLHGEEIATTEWNLLELELLARWDPQPGREHRRAALEKLRRRLTVLPIDERSVEAVAALRGSSGPASSIALVAILGTLESRGCTEWFTNAATARRAPKSKVQVQILK